MDRWTTIPTLREFSAHYYAELAPKLDTVFGGAESLYSVLLDLNERGQWAAYRAQTLGLDPAAELERLVRHIDSVEAYFGVKLEGESVLFGAFASMDGYARFDRGKHVVYLGVDENHGPSPYLDVLMTHELTHVARESQPEVWTGFGLNPKMTHDEFTENIPVIEHLMNEGFSCVVSEALVPIPERYHYAYQSEASLRRVESHGSALDRVIHAQIALGVEGDYGKLYRSRSYHPTMPDFAHYVWAWQWVKALVKDYGGGDPRALLKRCSADFIEHALRFKLVEII